jgi:hypothetical protein
MITIRKDILSNATPQQIRDQTANLSAPLRDLAVSLAEDPNLTVSVITYDNGAQELEVLHTGPPHRTEDTIDQGRFTRQPDATPPRTLAIATQSALADAVELVRAILGDAQHTTGLAASPGYPTLTSAMMNARWTSSSHAGRDRAVPVG